MVSPLNSNTGIHYPNQLAIENREKASDAAINTSSSAPCDLPASNTPLITGYSEQDLANKKEIDEIKKQSYREYCTIGSEDKNYIAVIRNGCVEFPELIPYFRSQIKEEGILLVGKYFRRYPTWEGYQTHGKKSPAIDSSPIDLFSDDEILQVHEIKEERLLRNQEYSAYIKHFLGDDRIRYTSFCTKNPKIKPSFLFQDIKTTPLHVRFTENKKAIFQQIGKRNIETVIRMLIFDETAQYVDIKCSLETHKDIYNFIKNFGLHSKHSMIFTIEDLKKIIKEGGSAVVRIEEYGLDSPVIVDTIENDYAIIRDPYHGWSISVTIEALEKRFRPETTVIQIEKQRN